MATVPWRIFVLRWELLLSSEKLPAMGGNAWVDLVEIQLAQTTQQRQPIRTVEAGDGVENGRSSVVKRSREVSEVSPSKPFHGA